MSSGTLIVVVVAVVFCVCAMIIISYRATTKDMAEKAERQTATTPTVDTALPAENRRTEVISLAAEREAKPVRVAMGPIIGAIVIANLITAVIGAVLYALVK